MGKKDKNNIKYKRRRGTNVLLIMVITLTIYLCKPVYAVDMSYSGLSDIMYMWQHSNGNIRAMDSVGHVAEFNYVKWSIINETDVPYTYGTGQYHNYIKETKSIFKNGKIYDTESNTWSNIPASGVTYVFAYTNKVYAIKSIQLDPNDYWSNKFLRLEEYDLDGNFIRNIDFTNIQIGRDSLFVPVGYNNKFNTLTLIDDRG